MELWVWENGCSSALVLDTGGMPPMWKQRGLMLCRSLTLPADRLLAGPVQLEGDPTFWRLDPDGSRIPGEMQDAAVFLACFAAAGYGAALAASDGYHRFCPPQPEVRRWRGQRLCQSQLAALLSVDQSCWGASTTSDEMRLRKSSPFLGSP